MTRKSDMWEQMKSVPLNFADDPILRDKTLFVEAIYHSPEWELLEHRDNELVLALPPFLDVAAILSELSKSYSVAHTVHSRDWNVERKLLGIGRLRHFGVVLPIHKEILVWVSRALRVRYGASLPDTSAERVKENYALTQCGTPTVLMKPESEHSLCFSLLGVSGTGKTTAVNMVLSL